MASTMMTRKDLELGLGKDEKLSFKDDAKITKQRTIVFVFAVMGCALVGAICWSGSGRTESSTSQNGTSLRSGRRPQTVNCKYGDACYNEKCPFHHPGGQNRVGLKNCRHGDACYNEKCPFQHPGGQNRVGLKNCRHGDACYNEKCPFHHPGGQNRVGLKRGNAAKCSDAPRDVPNQSGNPKPAAQKGEPAPAKGEPVDCFNVDCRFHHPGGQDRVGLQEDKGIFDRWRQDLDVWQRAQRFYEQQGWVYLSKLPSDHYGTDSPETGRIHISKDQKKKIQDTFSESLQAFFPDEKYDDITPFTCQSAEANMKRYEFAADRKLAVPWHVDALHVRPSNCHKVRICVALGDGATNTVKLLRTPEAEEPRKSLQEYFDLWDEEFWTLSTFACVLYPRWHEDEEGDIPRDLLGKSWNPICTIFRRCLPFSMQKKSDSDFWQTALNNLSAWQLFNALDDSLQEKIKEIKSHKDPLGALRTFVCNKFRGKYRFGEVLAQTRRRTHPERLPLVESVQKAINNGDAIVVTHSETCDTLGRMLLVNPRTGFHRSPPGTVAAGKRRCFAKMDFFGRS